MAVFTSSVFHNLAFPYRLQSHSSGAHSFTFFHLPLPPLQHSVLRLSLISQQRSSLLLNAEGQLPFLSVGDFPTALFRHGVWAGWAGGGGTHSLLEASLEFVLHFCRLQLCERTQASNPVAIPKPYSNGCVVTNT